MRTYWFGTARRLSSLAVLLLLVACGGGGGGGGGGPAPVVYGGNSSAAIVTPTNASKLTANVVGSSDTAAIILGVSIEAGDATQDRGSGAMDLALRLNRTFVDTVLRANSAQGVTPGVQIDQTDLCDGGGSVRTVGTLSDFDGRGTLTVSFNNCLIDGVTLNGPGTLRVDAVDFSGSLPIPTDFTMSFARLTLRGPGLSIDAGGSLRAQLELGANRETIKANQVSLNNNTGETTKTENFVIVSVYDSISFPTAFTANIGGRVFDQVHGYVDVTTAQPLVFETLTQLFPDSGQMLLTGAGNSSIRVTALSATLARLELDLDGNNTYEIDARLKWTDLSGPVGSDLADDDVDGMHNSWETAHPPMDPNSNDAAPDNDGDDFSNLGEYQGGGDPNNAAIIPSMLVDAFFPVANDVALANSDTERPGRSAIGSDGTNYLLVSCRDLGSTAGLFGVLLSGSGQALNTFPISTESCPVRPAVAFDGTNYLVALSRNGQIHGIRVTPEGVVLDAAGGFPISTAGSNFSPAIAFDGTNHLVVWNKFVDNSQYEIFGASVTPAGGALGEFPIFTAPGEQIFPALAFDGTNYLVIWRDTRSGSGPSIDTHLFGTRVTSVGNVLDPLGIAIATAPGNQEPGGIVFDGTNYFVVWDHTPTIGVSPPPDGKIFGRRITPAGVLLDGTASSDGSAISTGLFANHSSSVAFSGNHYVVTWAAGSFPNFPPAGIFAARVSKNGSRIDGLPDELGMAISGPPASFSRFVYPVVASRGQSALVSWVNNIELSGTQKDILGVAVSGF